MNTITATLAIACYLAGAILQYFNLTRRDKSTRAQVLAAGSIAWLLHTFNLHTSLWIGGKLYLGVDSAASLIGWLVAGLVIISSLKKPLENLFLLIYPLAALTLSATLVFPGHTTNAQPFDSHTAAHILLSLLSYSVLTIAAIQAILLAVQDHHLRHHQANGFVMRLPPLQVMEKLLFELIWVGLLLLSAAIVTGAVFIQDMSEQHLSHKTILSVVAWLIFSILLFGKHRMGWRGTTAIRFTLGGYFLLMLAYFGTKVVLEIILKV